MPDQTVATRRLEPPVVPVVVATLFELGGAHARVTSRGADEVEATFGSAIAQLCMVGEVVDLRQLLDDAAAQLSAIEAQRPEEPR